MKRSTEFKLTPAQRHRDRRRAEQVLGHPLGSHPVHHHSPTQLVICESTDYHALLHQRHYAWRMQHDEGFGEREIARIEATTAKIQYECELLKAIICRATGRTPEDVTAEIAQQLAALPARTRPPSPVFEFNDTDEDDDL